MGNANVKYHIDGKPNTAVPREWEKLQLVERGGTHDPNVTAKRIQDAIVSINTRFSTSFGGSSKKRKADVLSPPDDGTDCIGTPSLNAASRVQRSRSNRVTPPPTMVVPDSIPSISSGDSHLPTKSISDTPLRRLPPTEGFALAEGDCVNIVVNECTHKFSDIKHALGPILLSDHKQTLKGKLFFEFEAVVTECSKRHALANSLMTNADRQLSYEQGDGITVQLSFYNLSFPIRYKDVVSGCVQIWTEASGKFATYPPFDEMCGDSILPSKYDPLFVGGARMVEYDTESTTRLLHDYQRRKIKTLNYQHNKIKKKLRALELASEGCDYSGLFDSMVVAELSGPSYFNYLDYVDKIYENAIKSSFCQWQNTDTPLLSDLQHAEILRGFEHSFPRTAHCFYVSTLRDVNLRPSKSALPLVIQKKHVALGSFLANARSRNSHKLVHWAIVDTLAHVSRGTPKIAMERCVWRRYALSYRTTFRILNAMAESAVTGMRRLLQAEERISGAFDNFQLIQKLKFQRNGRSSKDTKGTVRVAVRNHKVPPTIGSVVMFTNNPWYNKEPWTVTAMLILSPYQSQITIYSALRNLSQTILWPQHGCSLKFLNGCEDQPKIDPTKQHIPRTLHMRRQLHSSSQQMVFDDYYARPYAPCSSSCTSRSVPCDVETYMIALRESRTISKLKRFLSPHLPTDAPVLQQTQQHSTLTPVPAVPQQTRGSSIRKTNRAADSFCYISKKVHSLSQMLLSHHTEFAKATSFQERYVKSWNPFIDSVSELLYLPISKHDEISKDGCLQVLVELLHDFGILNKSKDGSSTYTCVDAMPERMLFLSGDCLSMDNIRHQENRVLKALTHPGNGAFVQTVLDAMGCVREGVGDLHVGMHQLVAIFGLYYPGLLQVCQAVLGWKRIQLNPIKNYQASRMLLKLVVEELERYRMREWVDQLQVNSNDNTGNPLHIPSELSKDYEDMFPSPSIPLDMARKHLTKQHFISTLAHNYQRFILELQNGTDEIVRFMSNFLELSDSYLSYLDAIRCGDSVALEALFIEWLPRWRVTGKNKYKDLVMNLSEVLYRDMKPQDLEEWRWNRCVRLHEGRAMIAMDDLCEILNDHTKKMAKTDGIDSLTQRTIFMSLMRSCAMDVSRSARSKKATETSRSPAQNRERMALTKLFQLGSVWTPNNRKLGGEFLWKHYKRCKMPTKATVSPEDDVHEAEVRRCFNSLAAQSPEVMSEEEQRELIEALNQQDGNRPNLASEEATEAMLSDVVNLEQAASTLSEWEQNDMANALDNDETGEVSAAVDAMEEDNVVAEDVEADVVYDDMDEASDEEESEVVLAAPNTTRLKELANIKKYDIVKTGLKNIDAQGWVLLGENLCEERHIQHEQRIKQKQLILESVAYYESLQVSRLERRNKLITKAGTRGDRELQEWEVVMDDLKNKRIA